VAVSMTSKSWIVFGCPLIRFNMLTSCIRHFFPETSAIRFRSHSFMAVSSSVSLCTPTFTFPNAPLPISLPIA